MTEVQISPTRDSVLPGGPRDTFSSGANEHDDYKSIMNCNTSISTPSTGTQDAINTNTISGVYTNTIQIQRKNTVRAIRVSELQWKLFLQKARELGFTGNELINQFINSVVTHAPIANPKAPPTFNIAIAKAESKPVINVGEYVALKQLNDFLAECRRLRDRAEREQCNGQVLTFTRERARAVEEGLLKALKSLKSLPPDKLQEVEAALSILKGIREGRA